MIAFDTFVIPFRDLKPGVHNYEFIAGDSFFESYPEGEIHQGQVHIVVKLVKEERMMDFHFSFNGHVLIPCDRCNEPVTIILEGKERLIVKLGEEFREETDEVQIIPESERAIDLAPFIYEYIYLLLPMKRVHPDGPDGISTCNPEILKKLEELNKRIDQDDRWETLKKLKIEN